MSLSKEAIRKFESAPLDLRFAVLFAPRAQRDALTSLLAAYLEIYEIPNECSDIEVAQAKLGWWHDEAERLSKGHATHPLAMNLAQYLPQPKPDHVRLAALIDAIAADISPPSFMQFEHVRRYCQRQGGMLTELLTLYAGAHNAETVATAGALGTAWKLIELMTRYDDFFRRGRCYFAISDLRKYGLEWYSNGGANGPNDFKPLLDDYAQQARNLVESATLPLSAESDTLVVPRILYSLAWKKFKKFALNGYGTAHAPVELRPFSQLFTAWRAARRSSMC